MRLCGNEGAMRLCGYEAITIRTGMIHARIGLHRLIRLTQIDTAYTDYHGLHILIRLTRIINDTCPNRLRYTPDS